MQCPLNHLELWWKSEPLNPEIRRMHGHESVRDDDIKDNLYPSQSLLNIPSINERTSLKNNIVYLLKEKEKSALPVV